MSEFDQEQWKIGKDPDSDELMQHLQPADTGKSVAVPAGRWVDVPDGMVVADHCYTDEHGVLRDDRDGSCVVWHNQGCQRRGITALEIEYAENGSPWCPECFTANAKKARAKTN